MSNLIILNTLVSELLTLVMLKWWWVVIFLTSLKHWWLVQQKAHEFDSIPGKWALHQKDSLRVAVYGYILPYIMHCVYLCYAKEAWWKEFHHWEMEFYLPLLPVIMSVLEVLQCTLEENPLCSTLVELWRTWPFDSSRPSCMRCWAGTWDTYKGGWSEMSKLYSDPFSVSVDWKYSRCARENRKYLLGYLLLP